MWTVKWQLPRVYSEYLMVTWLSTLQWAWQYKKTVDFPLQACLNVIHLHPWFTTDWKAIPTCLEKLTVWCSVTSVCCCQELWVIQYICMERHSDNCSGSSAVWEGLWLRSWYTWLLSEQAPPPTHTQTQFHSAFPGGKRRIIEPSRNYIHSFLPSILLPTLYHLQSVDCFIVLKELPSKNICSKEKTLNRKN